MWILGCLAQGGLMWKMPRSCMEAGGSVGDEVGDTEQPSSLASRRGVSRASAASRPQPAYQVRDISAVMHTWPGVLLPPRAPSRDSASLASAPYC